MDKFSVYHISASSVMRCIRNMFAMALCANFPKNEWILSITSYYLDGSYLNNTITSLRRVVNNSAASYMQGKYKFFINNKLYATFIKNMEWSCDRISSRRDLTPKPVVEWTNMCLWPSSVRIKYIIILRLWGHSLSSEMTSIYIVCKNTSNICIHYCLVYSQRPEM